MSKIIIYKNKNGHIDLTVNLSEETVWLSLNQLAQLFGRDKSVISRHLSNIFKTKELNKNSVVANFATVQKEGTKNVRRKIDYYNLDAIISIGYRVNSVQATQFRQWATDVLRKHLIEGYTVNKNRLAENGIKELQQSIKLLQKTLKQNNLVNDIGAETIQIIINYTKTWNLLLSYDEDKLNLPKTGKPFVTELNYETALNAIKCH